jgi:hypothetical protein
MILKINFQIEQEKMEQRNVQKEVWEMEENLPGTENDEILNNNSSRSRNNENAVNPLSKLLWASLKKN